MQITAYPRRQPVRNDGAYEVVAYGPTSIPARLIARLADATYNFALSEAPRRSGTLRDSHEVTNVTRGTAGLSRSGRNLAVRVVNTAPHATFVHNGTVGPIQGKPMMFWTTYGGPNVAAHQLGPWKAEHVAGQRANPWLVRAYNRARTVVPGLTNIREMSSSITNVPAQSKIVARRPWVD